MNNPALVVAAVACGWIPMSLSIGFIFGWKSLAKRYAGRVDLPIRQFRQQSATLRFMMQYKRCVNVTVGKDMLGLSVLLPFRIGHPSVAIPWDDIQTKHGGSLFWNYCQLNFSKVPHTPVRVSRNLAAQIAEASDGQFSDGSSVKQQFDGHRMRP